MPSISYAVTVSTEHAEVAHLLDVLLSYLREEDEIVVQIDESNTTKEVHNVVLAAVDADSIFNRIHITTYPLNNDFASFKNNIKRFCLKDYVFFIDADEVPSHTLLSMLPEILSSNPSVELYYVPRINTVAGITEEHIRTWRWSVNEKGWINFPDYQTRIIKNTAHIEWEGRVHERLEHATVKGMLPADEPYCLLHPKTIEKQKKQNRYYTTLS